jgi:outer membrane protein OmpA-like peptidoglycan-associated protein
VQTKTVNATATVTGGGQTASCTIPVRVTSIPPVVHYGDIVFAQASARVNNAAKRILIERLYPQLAGPYQGYTLLMVGHRDGSEPAARQMDRRRVLNTAAVLSANRDTCKDIELSRMRADWVGTANTEYKQTAAASSVTERTADRINPNDRRAQNRRVELWLIPPSASMPGVVRDCNLKASAETEQCGCFASTGCCAPCFISKTPGSPRIGSPRAPSAAASRLSPPILIALAWSSPERATACCFARKIAPKPGSAWRSITPLQAQSKLC